MKFDVERARRDTPGVKQVLHLNNAGAALMPHPVVDTVKHHLDLEARIGGYEAAEREAEAIERVYGSIARLLNCVADEVAVVENATRAWDMAFYALARSLKRGDRILTAHAEYGSNFLALLQVAKLTGAAVEVLGNGPDGALSLADLDDALGDGPNSQVKLVAITHVPTNGGLVNPVAAVGRRARAAGVPFLLDACQSAGQMPLDVQAIGCDMLAATGRKFLRGPRGTGFLYVRRGFLETLEPPFVDIRAATWTAVDRYALRDDARRFETWEGSVAGKLGLGAAVDYALGWDLGESWARIRQLASRLRDGLAAVPGVAVHDAGSEKCGIVTLTKDGRDAEAMVRVLRDKGINVSASPMAHARLDLEHRGLAALLRASVHYYNTDEEIDTFVRAIAEAV